MHDKSHNIPLAESKNFTVQLGERIINFIDKAVFNIRQTVEPELGRSEFMRRMLYCYLQYGLPDLEEKLKGESTWIEP